MIENGSTAPVRLKAPGEAGARVPGVDRGWRLLGLAVVLALASLLRFAGLDHNLRRAGPHNDELNNFVAPILRMWQTGSLDPMPYSGYAGTFNYIAFPAVVAGYGLAGDYGAFLGARAVIAAASVASVLLAFLAGARAFGYGAGLLAALLLTFSRVDVMAAHSIAPDVVVGTLALGLLLAGSTTTSPGRAAWLLGALAGLATSIKYNGLLLVPTGLAVLATRPRLRATAPVFLLSAAACFAIAAPFAIANLGQGEQGAGIAEFVLHYYGVTPGEGAPHSALPGAPRLDLGQLRLALGDAALVVAALATLVLGPRGVTLPAAVLVAATLASVAPAVRFFPRHMVPAIAPAALLAAGGAFWLAGKVRRPGARAIALVLVIGGLLWAPVPSAVLLARSFTVPAGPDRAAEWIEANVSGPARVLAVAPFRFPLDRARFEVVRVEQLDPGAIAALAHFDILVVAPARDGERLARRLRWPARWFADPFGPRDVLALLRPAAEAPTSRRVTGLSGSSSLVAAALDGKEGTAWRGAQGDAMEISLPGSPRVSRVEIDAGRDQRDDTQDYALEGLTDPPDGWSRLDARALRPVRPQLQGSWHAVGQAYVLTPSRSVSALRVSRSRGGGWSVGEIRVFADAVPEAGARSR